MTSTMNRGVSALFAASLLAAAQLTSPSVALADEFVPTWHAGWCARGEGQSVVVDLSAKPAGDRPGEVDAQGLLIRCNIGATYPEGVDGRMAALDGVGIPYEPMTSGLVDWILGVSMDNQQGKFWIYTTSAPGSNAWDGPWDPDPVIDTAVGVTWGGTGTPTVNPQFS